MTIHVIQDSGLAQYVCALVYSIGSWFSKLYLIICMALCLINLDFVIPEKNNSSQDSLWDADL